MAATDLERLVVQLSADVRGYQNALNKAQGQTTKSARAIEARFQKMSGNINRSFQEGLKGAVAITGGLLGVSEIEKYADAWTQAGNKITAAAISSGVQARSLSDIRKGADAARVSFADYVDLYTRLIRSASGAAKSEQEIATATDIVSKAFKAGGASAEEQAAGILQLGQALGSGVLQGDELRSIRENAPLIAQAIATEFKTTIGGLKQLGAEGKLTSERVFKAILNAQKPIEAQFAATNATIGDGFTVLKNSVTEYIGTQAQAYGITKTVNGILVSLAGNIGSVANAAAAAAIVLTAAFAGPAIVAGAAALLNPFALLAGAVGAAAYAFTQFQDTLVPLQGSFATLGDYATALWQLLGDGASSAQAAVVGAFDAILTSINSALSGVGTSINGVWDAVKAGINAIINSFRTLSDVVVATFQAVPAAIGESVLGAMNAMIAGVEVGINKVISAVNAAIGAINSLGSYAGVAAIPTLSSVDIGRLENDYAGAGERAGKAFNDAISKQPTDYLAAAGSAVASSVDKAVTAITTRANDIAAARSELERETNRASNFGGIEGPSTNTKGFGGGIPATGSGGGGKKKKSEYEKEIQQIKDRTAALLAETDAQSKVNPLIDDYGYASTRAKTAQELLTAAQKSGLAAGKELTDVQQLLSGNFDSLSPAAQQQATAMLALAEGYATASSEAEKLSDRQQKIKAAVDDFKDTSKSVLSGFISDMRNGTSAAEALENALNKVVDKLIDVALNAAFDTKGGSGGLGSLLSGLFGGGGGSQLSLASAGGLGLYADGGYTGMGGKNEPAGIVHKGEFVIPADAVKRLGVENLRKLQGYANGGYVGSAPSIPNMSGSRASDQQQVAVTVRVDNDGNLKAFVQRESAQVSAQVVQATAPSIIDQSTQSAGTALGKGKFDSSMSKYGVKRQANVG